MMTITTRAQIAFCFCAGLWPVAGQASEFRYNHVDFVLTPSFETSTLDGGRFDIEFSRQVHPNVRIIGEFGRISYDNAFRDITGYAFGVGLVHQASSSIDMIFGAQVARQNGLRENGSRLSAGLHVGNGDPWYGSIEFVSERMISTERYARIAMMYQLSRAIGVGVRVQKGSRFYSTGVLFRYKWY